MQGRAVTPAPDVRVDEESPCCIGYTSASTGVHKGVLVPHRAVRDLVTVPVHGELHADDRVGSVANPASDTATWEAWGALTTGAIADRRRGRRVAAAVAGRARVSKSIGRR
ncbi:AMP-binding protein [Streptomyces sp. NPDC050147]|uniref:AMP-binding protein n=1 Tax=Streptomyces sp. NPDC050147 TaxID=3155513 RepID=UPI00341F2E5D